MSYNSNAIRTMAGPRYLYIRVGKGGAEVTERNATKTVSEGTLIRVNPDGSLTFDDRGDK